MDWIDQERIIILAKEKKKWWQKEKIESAIEKKKMESNLKIKEDD